MSQAGKRNNYPCHVCGLVLDKIRLLEAGLDSGAGPSYSHSSDHMVSVESGVRSFLATKGGSHPSVAELMFWVVRGLGVVSLVVLLLFLFFHDY